jgi:hypothetical protein
VSGGRSVVISTSFDTSRRSVQGGRPRKRWERIHDPSAFQPGKGRIPLSIRFVARSRKARNRKAQRDGCGGSNGIRAPLYAELPRGIAVTRNRRPRSLARGVDAGQTVSSGRQNRAEPPGQWQRSRAIGRRDSGHRGGVCRRPAPVVSDPAPRRAPAPRGARPPGRRRTPSSPPPDARSRPVPAGAPRPSACGTGGVWPFGSASGRRWPAAWLAC